MGRDLLEEIFLEYGGWDLHYQIVPGMKSQMPPFDQAFAALIRDLDRTGLLNRTVVMVSSEFGRTPKINKDAGRDHWARVNGALLAGGGLRTGQVVGSTTARGALGSGGGIWVLLWEGSPNLNCSHS